MHTQYRYFTIFENLPKSLCGFGENSDIKRQVLLWQDHAVFYPSNKPCVMIPYVYVCFPQAVEG